MKEKVIGTFQTMYTQAFKSFLNSTLYNIPPEYQVMAEAFSINRDELLIKSIKMVLEDREAINANF